MKKKFSIGLLFASVAMLFGTSSCKKDWLCSCTFDGTTQDCRTHYGSGKIPKSEAKKSCDATLADLKIDYSSVSCKLK